MDSIEITLRDASSKSKTFQLVMGKKRVYSKPISTERGFGFSHTDSAEINGYKVSGDMWRFLKAL